MMPHFPQGPGIWGIFNQATRIWVHGYAGYILSMFVIATVIILVR